jgi:ribonuclease G
VKKILINNEIWQTRVAIVGDNDKLQDIYFDSQSKIELERSFFKGKVSKVLPGIQTAFVDIGQPKAGFLHISEIDRAMATEKITEYLQIEDSDESLSEREIKSSLDVGKIFNEGDEILVQVIKEPIHEKGAKLTTCFALPGKFLVLMPNIPQIGISKKIESREERARLKEFMQRHLPTGMGVIIRTTAEGRSEKDIKKDLSFLVSAWNSIQKKYKKATAGEKIHEDIPLSLRAIREHLDEEVEMVITDSKEDQAAIYKFVKYFTPEYVNKIRFYQGPPVLFDRFEIDKQIEKALEKKVVLKSGGSLIIETTEAMTVIDVNTGKFTGSANMEETILKTNLEAADEIVTQLRLRNIGGLIVIDFIDMAMSSSRQKLSRFLEKTLKERDKFQSVTLKISEFNLVQMTRKRSGKTLLQQLTHSCPMCSGHGFVKSTWTISFGLLSRLREEVTKKRYSGNIVFAVSHSIFDYLVHNEYFSILALEKQLGCKITLESREDYEDIQCTMHKLDRE